MHAQKNVSFRHPEQMLQYVAISSILHLSFLDNFFDVFVLMKSLSIYFLVGVLAFLCFVAVCFIIHPLQIQSQMI